MGMFNTLTACVTCANCKAYYNDVIQFQYGSVWQHKYILGDELLWGKNDIGIKAAKTVIVYGISELSLCPVCGLKSDIEYDVIIYNNIIYYVRTMETYDPYRLEEGGRFYIPSN